MSTPRHHRIRLLCSIGLLLITLCTATFARADRSVQLAYSIPAVTGETCVAMADTRQERLYAQQTGLDAFDDEAEYATTTQSAMISDPLEGWNRFWFRINDTLYVDVLKPLHKGYTVITPWELRSGVANFFHNLLFPVRFAGAILQGKFADASVESARFIVNTTAGFGGLMNPAQDKKPLIDISGDEEDIGQAFGAWGIGEGVYIVWPLLGPSTLRDTAGMVGDSFLNPVSYVTPWHSSLGLKAYDRFNTVDAQIAQYEELKKSAVEPYIAIRNAYVQARRAKVAK